MSSAISYEFYKSQAGVANGYATLDSTGTIPVSQLPTNMDLFQGEFTASADLIAAVPAGQMAWFAYVTDTLSFWYWDTVSEAWENQMVLDTTYLGMTAEEQSVVPWIIGTTATVIVES